MTHWRYRARCEDVGVIGLDGREAGGVARPTVGLAGRIALVGLIGGPLAGAVCGFVVVYFSAAQNTLYYALLLGVIGGVIVGFVTGLAASAAFLLAWWPARRLRGRWLVSLVAAASSGVVTAILFACVWFAPGNSSTNLTLGVVTFGWWTFAGCVAAAGVYFWIGLAYLRDTESAR